MTPKQKTKLLSKSVRNHEDMMQLRVMLQARLVTSIKESQGIDTTQKHKNENDDKEAENIIKLVEAQYLDLCEFIKEHDEASAERVYNGEVSNLDIKRALKKQTITMESIIKDQAIFMLCDQYMAIKHQEKRIKHSLKALLKGIPIYDHFMLNVKGCGERISSELIAYIDIHKSEYPSSLWKLAGLDVASDGKGRSRRTEHFEEKEYIDKEGNEAKRKGITFNPKLKRTLYYLGEQFNRSPDSKYGKILRDYKHRITNDPKHAEKTKGHIQAMAMRYAEKQFLVDLYSEWRDLENLPVAQTYAEAKLGIVHKKAAHGN